MVAEKREEFKESKNRRKNLTQRRKAAKVRRRRRGDALSERKT
jgi:hypothetical protein